jgi:hypothetical protein
MDANWWRMYYKFVCECGVKKTTFGSMKYYGTL